LRLTIERDFFPFGEKRADQNLASLAAFSAPIECFSPGAELQFLLGSGPTLFGNNADSNIAPLQFDITAAYSFEGSSVIERSTVDLRPYMNSAVPHDPIVEELERMRNVLTEMQRSLRRDG